jgi:hypothetical protein
MSIDSNDYNSDFVLSSHTLKKYESESQISFNSFISNPFKKPFLPTSWKWFRTSGEEKIYNYMAKEGETVKLDFKIPKEFTFALLSSARVPYSAPNGNISLKLEGDTGDFIRLGKRETVLLRDAESQIFVPTTFPSLQFREDGIDYKLDWQHFAEKRPIAKGAFDEGWGYSINGNPVFGTASMYDTTLKLNWERKLNWWWLLVGAILGLGVYRYSQKAQ